MPRNSTSIRAGAGAVIGTRRSASAASKAWLGAVLQTVREGSAIAIQTLLADLQNEGHIVPAAEADMINDLDRDPESTFDAEIDLSDEDEARGEVWADPTNTQEAAAIAHGAANDRAAGSLIFEPGYQIIVDEEVCRLHLPDWAGNESRTEFGQRILDELGNRFLVLERIARWLSEHRKQFLVSADPWYLGCDAFEELRAGHVPVSPKSFLEFTRIGKLAKPEAFSRYTRDCFLVWPDATTPLSILFDSRARQAWVANVIQQLAENQGRKLSLADLNPLRNTTKPRTRRRKQELALGSVDSVGFSEVLIRAVTLADVGLAEVLARYDERIITKSHE